MRTILAIALCALAMPAFADCGLIIQPPPQFNQPLNYDPTYVLRDYWDVDAYCRAHGTVVQRGHIEACSFQHTIVLPTGDGITPERQHCYFIHERAHREGWSPEHEGGFYGR